MGEEAGGGLAVCCGVRCVCVVCGLDELGERANVNIGIKGVERLSWTATQLQHQKQHRAT